MPSVTPEGGVTENLISTLSSTLSPLWRMSALILTQSRYAAVGGLNDSEETETSRPRETVALNQSSIRYARMARSAGLSSWLNGNDMNAAWYGIGDPRLV